jgi:hypothetical protein
MQSLVRTGPSSTIKNPFLGNTVSYRIAAAPAPTSNTTRMVTTMAKKKVILIFDSLPKYRMSNTAVL